MKLTASKRRIWRISAIGFCLIIGLTLFLALGTSLRAYQVTGGDTLWDLSGKFLKNPFLWPKVWALNPTIQNPHWIYPGNKVRLKAPTPAAPTRRIPQEAASARPKVVEPVIRKAAPPIFIYRNIHAEGFISPKKIKEVGRVLTNKDNTPMNALPKDLCFYAREGQAVLPGDHFSTFTYIKEVAVKECQKSYQIQLGGELEVYRVEGRFCFAKILYNYTEISKGDPIARFRRWPEKLVITPFKKPLRGRILSMKEGCSMEGVSRILYIDKGEADGLHQGSKLSIYKDCPTVENPYHPGEKVTPPPSHKIGSLIVLATQAKTATAMVLGSNREVEIGDKVQP